MLAVVKIALFIFIGHSFGGCESNNQQQAVNTPNSILPVIDSLPKTKTISKENSRSIIETGNVSPTELLTYAKTLLGIPYLYASTDPAKGFDCSGFITYVFNHFGIAVPRSSVDFTNVGTEVAEMEAAPGDLVLFTGTDSTIRIVGHMGIVESNKDGKLQFIHSTSGKAKGVVITPFEKYYRSRFVKFIRIFPTTYFD
jgi:cell wall-associated NlpC family hydrolase